MDYSLVANPPLPVPQAMADSNRGFPQHVEESRARLLFIFHDAVTRIKNMKSQGPDALCSTDTHTIETDPASIDSELYSLLEKVKDDILEVYDNPHSTDNDYIAVIRRYLDINDRIQKATASP